MGLDLGRDSNYYRGFLGISISWGPVLPGSALGPALMFISIFGRGGDQGTAGVRHIGVESEKKSARKARAGYIVAAKPLLPKIQTAVTLSSQAGAAGG